LFSVTQIRPKDIRRFRCSSDLDSISLETVRGSSKRIKEEAKNFCQKRSLELANNMTGFYSMRLG